MRLMRPLSRGLSGLRNLSSTLTTGIKRSLTTSHEDMPRQNLPEKVGDLLTGLSAAAHAIGVEHHRNELADYRKRVRDSHLAQAKAAGFDVLGTDEEMGDLTVTGDIHQHIVPTKRNGLGKLIGSGLLGATVAAAACGGAYLATKGDNSGVPIDTDTTSTIRFVDE